MHEGLAILPSGYVVFHPPTEFDLASAPDVLSELDFLVEMHPRVAIDLSQITFIDSSGLSALVWVHKRALELGGEVVLYGASERARRLLELTQLESVFPIYAVAEDIPPWTPESPTTDVGSV